jgi:PTS system mannose-specific IIA component
LLTPPLASSLQSVAQHVYPDCRMRLAAVDVRPGASLDEVQADIRALESLGQGEVLIMADVFGATPCNAAMAAASGLPARVVAGVNVPMLWRTLCYMPTIALDDLVTRAVAGAAQGVMHVSVPHRQNQPTPPASHDQVQHQHQQ